MENWCHKLNPTNVISLLAVAFNASLRPPDTVFKIIFWLGYFNSCLNPIIYPCYSREFKLAFIRILKCRFHRRRRPGWRAYNYQGSHINSFYSRQDSNDYVNYGSYLNGSQRTLSSASPSPSYHTKGLSHFQEDGPRHARSRTPSVLSESILDHHLEPVEEDPTQTVGNPDQAAFRNWTQEQLNE